MTAYQRGARAQNKQTLRLSATRSLLAAGILFCFALGVGLAEILANNFRTALLIIHSTRVLEIICSCSISMTVLLQQRIEATICICIILLVQLSVHYCGRNQEINAICIFTTLVPVF
jgi:hypothetical protein